MAVVVVVVVVVILWLRKEVKDRKGEGNFIFYYSPYPILVQYSLFDVNIMHVNIRKSLYIPQVRESKKLKKDAIP